MTDAIAYQKLDHREHVLLRPGMYIGSVEPESQVMWVFDQGSGRMTRRDVRYVPGLHKVADEILMNAVDHSVRLKRQRDQDASVSPVKRICVSIDRETGVISVENDGDGIPVQPHPLHAVYVPELIFGHMLTSANYDDGAEERTIGGQNGIGAKACNIYSKWFEVETVDAERKKVYTQRFEDNMSVALQPAIRACSKKPYTKVTFLPDYSRFGLPDGLTDDMHALLLRRVYDVTAVTHPNVTVLLNGAKIACKSFERYCDLYIGMRGESNRVYENIADGWEAVVALSDGEGLQQVSFVNGVATLRGGRHVDHFVSVLCKRLGDAIESKRKLPVKSQFIKDNLFVFLRTTVPNPSFDSQSKETLTTPVSKLGAKIELSDKFIDRVYKLDGLIARVIGLSDVAVEKGMKKTDGCKRSTISGIPKLDDAEWAGTAKSGQCTLVLTEGDSAKAMAIAGIAVVGRQKFGVYPLRGKLLNVCDVSAQKVSENVEIANLKKILGLQTGRDYAATGDLRYNRIMVLADADTDGSHIKGLVMNLFAQQWPSLLRIDGFICSMLTPIVKVRNGRTKQEIPFYSSAEFGAWKASLSDVKEAGAWSSKYYKGLGTSTAQEAKVYFREMKLVSYVWDDRSGDAMDLAFNKKRANDRKAWLASYDPAIGLDSVLDRTVPYADFVDKDLIHFSSYDIARSIPSVMDGLKVSQRKVLYSCFKRNLREEIRVAQLAGYVSEHAAYHHGEASLHGAIINMAQDYVGSNNMNLLEPAGQFGSRLAGGADSASPRYIHTFLRKVARLVFPPDDDALLRHLEDDGVSVEPLWYLPIVPLILINGATGIGTGYSTSIPCYNPIDVIRALKSLMAGDAVDELQPWYRGFCGTLEVIQGRLCSRGVLQRLAPAKVGIMELPLGTWTDDFKVTLETFVEKNAGVRGFTNASSETKVNFVVTFADSGATDSWLTRNEDGLTRLEVELKLFSNKNLSTSNMHLFNPEGRITKYDDVRDIIREFYDVRFAAYEKRRLTQIETLSHLALVLTEKVRFLEMVVEGTLHLHKMTSSGGDLEAELARVRLAKFDGSYKYLTSMPMSSMSTDKKSALEQELSRTRGAVEALEGTNATVMWTHDLDALLAAL